MNMCLQPFPNEIYPYTSSPFSDRRSVSRKRLSIISAMDLTVGAKKWAQVARNWIRGVTRVVGRSRCTRAVYPVTRWGEGEGRTRGREGRGGKSRMKEGGVDRMWWLAGRQLPQSSIFRAWLQIYREREKERGAGERRTL